MLRREVINKTTEQAVGLPNRLVNDYTEALPKRSSRVLLFSIVAFALFMSTLDMTIVATALPAIQRGLHTTINWTGWTITIYGLGIIVMLPIAGKFGDRYGRRKIFMAGLAVFTISSLICGLAPNIYVLIPFRALQACGGGTLQPSATGLIVERFDKNRDRAIGMFGVCLSGGQVAGPIFGSLLVTYLTWRWIFFVNLPIGIVAVFMMWHFVPESHRKFESSERTDVRGIALFALFILLAIFGITNFGSKGSEFYDPDVILPLLSAVLSLCLYLRHARRNESPFLALRFLHGKGFGAVNSLNFSTGLVGFGMASLVPLYAEDRYHFVVLSAGTLLTARAVAMVISGAIAAIALRRTGYHIPMAIGYVAIAIGIFMLSIAPRFGLSPYAWLSVGACITGIGTGASQPAQRNACLQLAPDNVAMIAGIRNMFAQLGTITGVSVMTAVLNRSANPGLAQAHMFWIASIFVLIVLLPQVTRVPRGNGTW